MINARAYVGVSVQGADTGELGATLSAVPENALKYAVGLMLATYGTFWAVEGLGVLHGGRSLSWPGGDLALLGVLAGWLLLSRVLVAVLPRLRPEVRAPEPEEVRT